jgi:hypothetical protein
MIRSISARKKSQMRLFSARSYGAAFALWQVLVRRAQNEDVLVVVLVGRRAARARQRAADHLRSRGLPRARHPGDRASPRPARRRQGREDQRRPARSDQARAHAARAARRRAPRQPARVDHLVPSAASVRSSGSRTSKIDAPTSNVKPSRRKLDTQPPTALFLSSTYTRRPCPASSAPALNPPHPAPMTTTSKSLMTCVAARGRAGARGSRPPRSSSGCVARAHLPEPSARSSAPAFFEFR